MTINEIADRAYEHAEKCGFYGCDPEWEITKKIEEESQELIEAIDKKNYGQNYKTDRALKYLKILKNTNRFENDVKNTVGDELADIIITALAGAKKLGVDIESHVACKLRYNELREDHR